MYFQLYIHICNYGVIWSSYLLYRGNEAWHDSMKIVIIGAGIAGCSAYLQLRKHFGADQITVYEAYNTAENATQTYWKGVTHSSTLVVGGGLGIGPNGLHVLQRLDDSLVRDIVRDGYVISHGNMKSKHGRLLMRMDTTADPASSPTSQPTHVLGCSRHAAWRALRSRVPDDAIVTKRIAAVVANPDHRNLITFVDGSPPVEADLVIGADGLKSTAKQALFSEAAGNPYPPQYECVFPHFILVNCLTNGEVSWASAASSPPTKYTSMSNQAP